MKKTIQRILSCAILCTLFICNLPAASATELPDVPDDFWAAEAIQKCVGAGYYYPESDGSFGVGKEVTRAEFTVLLCRFFNWKPTVPPTQIYDDVTPDLWYAGAVEIAFRQGALTNVSENFHPDECITREDLAVMLVRALGYGTFAGLAQQLRSIFPDVKSNAGYISIIYGLGLMDGTSATTFSPSDFVTREQVAAILVRMHEKLREASPSRSGIFSSAKNLPDLTGFETIAVTAYRMTYNGLPGLAVNMEPEEVETIRDEAQAAGVPQLLRITGTAYQFREGDAADLAEVILETVKAEDYDGVFLEITGLTSTPQRRELTTTAELLRKGLDNQILYIAAEAPTWQGRLPGYDYTALGEIADRLVLMIESPVESIGDLTTAPLEPLEETYYSLSRMRGLVDAGKLSLMVSSTAYAWGNGIRGEALPGTKVAEILAGQQTRSFYSDRFACAYLESQWEDIPVTIWYLNGQAVEARIQLGRLFNVEQLCVQELDSALPEFLEALP
ncbi:MAG: hypothetical protein HFF84_03800 [Oscillibacter sp.]|nr:hypothetical protein [Oscillibacter sp.]